VPHSVARFAARSIAGEITVHLAVSTLNEPRGRPTDGPERVHEQQAVAESELAGLGRESVRSVFPGSQSAPQTDVYAEMPGKMRGEGVVSRPQLGFLAVED
jgi:hypothetical protein